MDAGMPRPPAHPDTALAAAPKSDAVQSEGTQSEDEAGVTPDPQTSNGWHLQALHALEAQDVDVMRAPVTVGIMDQSVDDIDNTVAPDRNQDNTPPEAVDDDFGVRAGKTVILPVLMNDSDADGDFMTASALTQPSLGQVSVAREGAALQIAVNKDASGTSTSAPD